MKHKFLLIAALGSLLFFSCAEGQKNEKIDDGVAVNNAESSSDFNYNVDQFADLRILRYQIPSWAGLSLKEQQLVYYLTQAGLEGRDIMWDQNYRHKPKN